MVWFLLILIIVFVAAYVYFSLMVATKLLTKILNLEKQVSDLFENDAWCEHEFKSLSKTTDELYDNHMTDISSVWKKMDELNNDINRAKMRIGKLEQSKGDTDEVDRS
jgi:peptidoglycan hydrolase CwlO-like protein